MEKEMWFGIPREEIDWFPIIDYKKCVQCGSCIRKCKRGVYEENADGSPKVVKPKNCVVGCTGCQAVCPAGAISHPPGKYLEELAKKKDSKAGCDCRGKCSK